QAQRALVWVRSWVMQHQSKFERNATESFGGMGSHMSLDAGYVYILPSAFKRCMDEGGFRERRKLRAFAERGWIQTAYRGANKKLRYKVRKHPPGTTSNHDRVEVVVLLPANEDTE